MGMRRARKFCASVRHSVAYEANCHPAYRVVARAFLPLAIWG